MKILKISPRYRGGGAERSARDLAHALIERGHTVEMWTAVPEENTPDWVKPTRTFAERLLFPINYIDPVADWRHFSTRKKINKLNADDFDIVHLHNLHGHWLSIKAVHQLCNRMPTIWSLRDGWAAYGGVPYDLDEVRKQLNTHDIHLKSPVHRPLYTSTTQAKKWAEYLKKWMPQPNRLLCPSRWIERVAIKGGYFKDPKCVYIPNGVTMTLEADRLPEKKVARQKLGIAPDQRVILMIAANLQSPFKGIPLGIKVLKQYKNITQSDDTTILLLGRNASTIKEHLKVFNNVISTYAGSNEELINAYRAADITLIPSIAEQFGLVAAESLLCQTPIICFDVGGISEIAGDSERGLKYKAFDTDAMAHGLKKLMARENQRRKMGETGQTWALHNCHYRKHIDRTVDIYSETKSHS